MRIRTFALTAAALAAGIIGAVNHYHQPAGEAATDKAAAAAIATVGAADRYGPCLGKLHATGAKYNPKDVFVPHAPATVRYTVPGGELVFALKPRPAGGLYTAPADAYTTQALDKAGC